MTIDFVSPRFIDALLAVIVIEALALAILVPAARRAADLWLTLVSGAALMLAIRVALMNGGATAMAAVLSAALIAHICYLGVRLGKK